MAVPPPPDPKPKNLANQLIKAANAALSAPLAFAPSASAFTIQSGPRKRGRQKIRTEDYKRGYSAGYASGRRKKCG
jgi:hypothetical protein